MMTRAAGSSPKSRRSVSMPSIRSMLTSRSTISGECWRKGRSPRSRLRLGRPPRIRGSWRARSRAPPASPDGRRRASRGSREFRGPCSRQALPKGFRRAGHRGFPAAPQGCPFTPPMTRRAENAPLTDGEPTHNHRPSDHGLRHDGRAGRRTLDQEPERFPLVTHAVRHILSSDLTVPLGGLPADGPRHTGGVAR